MDNWLKRDRGERAEDIVEGLLESHGCTITTRYRTSKRGDTNADLLVNCPNEPEKRIEVKEAHYLEKELDRKGKPYMRMGRFQMTRGAKKDCYAFVVEDEFMPSVTIDIVAADEVDDWLKHNQTKGKRPKYSITKVPGLRKTPCYDWLDTTILQRGLME